MEKQELKESVQCNLRSVTQSCKGGVPLNRLERDYRDLVGSHIPFRDLGYNSLESFIRDIPKVIRLTKGKDGFLMAEAVADSSTAHIASLISRQKQPKVVARGSKRSHFSQRRGGFNSKYAYRGERTPYSSYSAAKSSGRSYKQDFKTSPSYPSKASSYPSKAPPSYPSKTSPTYPSRTSPSYHSKTSQPNFKIEIKNTNSIPTESTSVPVVKAPPKDRTKPPLVVRGYEVAPRFQRLLRRKLEAEEQRSSASSPTPSNISPTPTRNSVTPPRTPTPSENPYAFTASSIASANSYETSRLESNGAAPISSSAMQVESSGYHSTKQRSPRPLRSRLNAVKSSKQLNDAKTAKEYIEIYAKMNNLSVEYFTTPIGQKKMNKGYITNLLLGENKYLSYPDVAPTEMEAEEIAAQKAVEKIKASQVLPETSISNSEEIQILLNRIEELVCEKPSGMFINGLQLEYESHFKEELPNCWIDLLHQSSVVDIEQIEVSYGRVPEGANFIVYLARGVSSGSTTPSEASGKMYPELQDSENEEQQPKGDMVDNSYSSVPLLEIPVGNEWGVFISGIYSVDNSQFVAARLVDADKEYLALSHSMSSYYNSKIDPVDVVEERHLYAAIASEIDGVLITHRVLVNRILNDDMIECYYVDEGTTGVVRKSDLQQLHKGFLELPYQAIHFALDGLEDYGPFITPEHLEFLKERTLIAVVKRYLEEFFLPDDPSIHKYVYSVILYDTEDPEINICLNDAVKRPVLDSLICKLPKLNVSSQGYLTHITSAGQIYLRFLNPVKSWLEIELEGLYALFEEACSENNVYIPSDKICVAKCKYDNKWYRAVVPEQPSLTQDPDLMEMIFVDYGYPSFVKKSEICDLQLFSEFLSNLSYQAVKCELYNALPSPESKWTIAASQRLIQMAAYNEELIIRVISEGEAGELPKVNLHKRIYKDEDSFIISINENLATRPELFLDSSAASTSNGVVKVPSELKLQHNTTQPSSNRSLSNYAPSVTSPVSRSVVSPLRNLEIASPAGIEWATTPDIVKSPEEEDLLPLPLGVPQVPDKGKIFDVFVTTAATPHNFIVQPLKSAEALNDLSLQMQQFYSAEENLIEMHPSLLKINSYYAALHLDNEWYRARLIKFDASDQALVYYVDYGDYISINLQNLQKLYQPFRMLPCQAIKASLAGVKPLDVDWNPEHCVQFKEMVTEKKYCSIVHNKYLKETRGYSYLELELTLVDTSDEKDIYIHELLIDNSMALKVAI